MRFCELHNPPRGFLRWMRGLCRLDENGVRPIDSVIMPVFACQSDFAKGNDSAPDGFMNEVMMNEKGSLQLVRSQDATYYQWLYRSQLPLLQDNANNFFSTD